MAADIWNSLSKSLSFGLDRQPAARAVKRVNLSNFGIVLAGFGLNGLGQKNFDINGSKKLRT